MKESFYSVVLATIRQHVDQLVPGPRRTKWRSIRMKIVNGLRDLYGDLKTLGMAPPEERRRVIVAITVICRALKNGGHSPPPSGQTSMPF